MQSGDDSASSYSKSQETGNGSGPLHDTARAEQYRGKFEQEVLHAVAPGRKGTFILSEDLMVDYLVESPVTFCLERNSVDTVVMEGAGRKAAEKRNMS